MFGNSDEKRIMREVDKVVSMKEDVDAMSWGRVLEIGRQLQTESSDEDRAVLGRELIGIAQSNVLMRARLGIEDPPSDDHDDHDDHDDCAMASEIEAHEHGLAEASASFTEMLLSDGEPEFELEFEPDEGPMLDHSLFHERADRPYSEVVSPPDHEDEMPSASDEPEAAFQRVRDGESSSPSDGSEMSDVESGPKQQPSRFGCFHNLYESKDGSLCVFEDEQGHLIAVDSSRLA